MLNLFNIKAFMLLLMFVLFCHYSEQYLVAWDKKGMPKDIDRLNNLTVLFTVSAVNVLVTCKVQELNIVDYHYVMATETLFINTPST